MKLKLSFAILSLGFSAITMGADAQKVYSQGTVTYKTNMGGQDVEVKTYFTPDSMAVTFTQGQANIKLLSDANYESSVVLLDVPAARIKKAAILTPVEIEQAKHGLPSFTFARTAETKQISGFNCIKVTATDARDQKTYEIWITNDINVSASASPPYYKGIGGFPVQYPIFQQGQSASVTVLNITAEMVPAGTFAIPPDYDKITMSDLKAMTGGK